MGIKNKTISMPHLSKIDGRYYMVLSAYRESIARWMILQRLTSGSILHSSADIEFRHAFSSRDIKDARDKAALKLKNDGDD